MLKKISQRSENQTHPRFTQRQNQKAVNTNTSVNTICLKQKQQWRLLKPQISKKSQIEEDTDYMQRHGTAAF